MKVAVGCRPWKTLACSLSYEGTRSNEQVAENEKGVQRGPPPPPWFLLLMDIYVSTQNSHSFVRYKARYQNSTCVGLEVLGLKCFCHYFFCLGSRLKFCHLVYVQEEWLISGLLCIPSQYFSVSCLLLETIRFLINQEHDWSHSKRNQQFFRFLHDTILRGVFFWVYKYSKLGKEYVKAVYYHPGLI